MKRHSMWLALMVVIVASLACAVPFVGSRTIKGSGNVVTEERDVSGFDRVALSGFGEVIITQGDKESLTVETDDNLMRYIETEVRGGTLELGFTDDDILLRPSKSIIFRLSVIDLTALDSSGAGLFEIDELDADRLGVTLSGAGDIRMDSLSANDLVITVSGAGNIKVAGQVKTQEVNLKALGNYNAPDLESQAATVRISGAGSASIWVHDTLDVTISGAGNVDYYGSPEVSKNISGVGKVTSQGDK
jgi:hypothetical protein